MKICKQDEQHSFTDWSKFDIKANVWWLLILTNRMESQVYRFLTSYSSERLLSYYE